MGLQEIARNKVSQRIRDELVDSCLQANEKVVLLGLAWSRPKSLLLDILMVEPALLVLTIGKVYSLCITDKRFLLFENSKGLTLKDELSSAVLVHDLPRQVVGIKQAGKISSILGANRVTFIIDGEELTLRFRPPFDDLPEEIKLELIKDDGSN